MKYLLPAIFLAASSLFFTNCYTTHVQSLDPAEKVVEENPGEHLVLFPRLPAPEDPVLALRLMHLPRQKVKIGIRQQLYLEKNESRLLGAGLALQWASLMVALKKDGNWTPMAVGLNLLGAASLLTRGKGGGYLGWFLPATIEKEKERYSATIERIAPESLPVYGAPVSTRAGGVKRQYRTDKLGQVRVDLVEDLDLNRFNSDRAISLEIDIPLANYRQVHHFLPGDFLYPYYTFDRAPYFPDRRMTGNPIAYTRPGQSYQVIDRPAPSIYRIALEDGSSCFLKDPDAHLTGFATTAPAASSPSPDMGSPLIVRQLRFDDLSGDGFLAPGEKGFLRFTLFNQSETTALKTEIAITPSHLPDIEFTPVIQLGEVAAEEKQTVAIPLRATSSANRGTHTLQIQAQSANGLHSSPRKVTI